MGKTERGAIWLNRKNCLHMIIGNFGEILMIEMLKDLLNSFTDIEVNEVKIFLKKKKILII